MKAQILSALKTEYKSLGLSEKALDGVASLLEKTVVDENGIDAAVKEASVAALLKIYQSEMDTERQKASKANRDLDEYRRNHPETTEEPKRDGEESEVMSLLKQMKADNEALRARMDASERQRSRENMMRDVRTRLYDTFKESPKANALLDIVLRNAEVGEEDTADDLVSRYDAEYRAQYKALYGDGVVPTSGGSQQPGYKTGKFAGVVSELQKSGALPKDTTK